MVGHTFFCTTCRGLEGQGRLGSRPACYLAWLVWLCGLLWAGLLLVSLCMWPSRVQQCCLLFRPCYLPGAVSVPWQRRVTLLANLLRQQPTLLRVVCALTAPCLTVLGQESSVSAQTAS